MYTLSFTIFFVSSYNFLLKIIGRNEKLLKLINLKSHERAKPYFSATFSHWKANIYES